MTFVKQGECIEAEKVLLLTRKKILQPAVEFDDIGFLCKYLCKKNSKATITEELNPKKTKCNQKSHLNLNDTLSADHIEVYSKKPLKFGKQANYSSKHGIQCANLNCYTYAIISVPFRPYLDKMQLLALTL